MTVEYRAGDVVRAKVNGTEGEYKILAVRLPTHREIRDGKYLLESKKNADYSWAWTPTKTTIEQYESCVPESERKEKYYIDCDEDRVLGLVKREYQIGDWVVLPCIFSGGACVRPVDSEQTPDVANHTFKVVGKNNEELFLALPPQSYCTLLIGDYQARFDKDPNYTGAAWSVPIANVIGLGSPDGCFWNGKKAMTEEATSPQPAQQLYKVGDWIEVKECKATNGRIRPNDGGGSHNNTTGNYQIVEINKITITVSCESYHRPDDRITWQFHERMIVGPGKPQYRIGDWIEVKCFQDDDDQDGLICPQDDREFNDNENVGVYSFKVVGVNKNRYLLALPDSEIAKFSDYRSNYGEVNPEYLKEGNGNLGCWEIPKENVIGYGDSKNIPPKKLKNKVNEPKQPTVEQPTPAVTTKPKVSAAISSNFAIGDRVQTSTGWHQIIGISSNGHFCVVAVENSRKWQGFDHPDIIAIDSDYVGSFRCVYKKNITAHKPSEENVNVSLSPNHFHKLEDYKSFKFEIGGKVQVWSRPSSRDKSILSPFNVYHLPDIEDKRDLQLHTYEIVGLCFDKVNLDLVIKLADNPKSEIGWSLHENAPTFDVESYSEQNCSAYAITKNVIETYQPPETASKNIKFNSSVNNKAKEKAVESKTESKTEPTMTEFKYKVGDTVIVNVNSEGGLIRPSEARKTIKKFKITKAAESGHNNPCYQFEGLGAVFYNEEFIVSKDQSFVEDFVQTGKSDLKKGTIRASAKRMTRETRDMLVLACKAAGLSPAQEKKILKRLNSEEGIGIISILLGFITKYAPPLRERPLAQQFSEEFRVEGVSTEMGAIMDRFSSSFVTMLMGRAEQIKDQMDKFEEKFAEDLSEYDVPKQRVSSSTSSSASSSAASSRKRKSPVHLVSDENNSQEIEDESEAHTTAVVR